MKILATKLEFACLLHRIAPMFDSDLMQMIYEEYVRTFYDKYTLFELISFLDARNTYIVGVMNKKNLCNIITKNAIDIPDKSWDDKYNKTKWELYNLRYIDYISYPHVTHVNKNVICIKDIQGRFEIMADDIVVVGAKEYTIGTISNATIILKHYNGNKECSLQSFMDMLDFQDAAITKNQVRSNTARHAYMERAMCMQLIATI